MRRVTPQSGAPRAPAPESPIPLPPSRPTAAVLHNPVAGRGGAADVAGRARARLEEAGWRVGTHATEGPAHAVSLARELAPGTDRLVVVGGDGTLREAAQGVLGTGTELAFVPLGNANVVARGLGIPLDTERAVANTTEGRPRPVDAARANGQLALAMVGVGWDAHVTRWIAAARRRGPWRAWYGRHADSLYGLLGLVALCEPRPARFDLEVDGAPLPARYCACVLSNVETYAKGWAVTPGAQPDDGWLDFQARKRSLPPYALWSVWCASRRRRVGPRVADHGRGRRFRLSGARPFAWQVDGDPQGWTRSLEVEVLPAAVALLAPAGLPRRNDAP